MPDEPDAFDEPAPRRPGWVIPLLVVLGLGGVAALVAVVLVGSALLGSDAATGTGATASPAPTTAGAAAPSSAVQNAAATMAGEPAPATVAGGLTFVSRAPDTAKITVSCDGVEATGTESVGLAATSAATCSVRVMLKDRQRLYGEVAGATAGTYTCFEGGTKDCVR